MKLSQFADSAGLVRGKYDEVLSKGGEEVISRGDFRVTFKMKEDGEIIIKVQAEKGIAVFPKSGNTIIIKNMETETA